MFIQPPQPDNRNIISPAARPSLGVQLPDGNGRSTVFWTIHAGAYGAGNDYNNADNTIFALENATPIEPGSWAILGDFNREPALLSRRILNDDTYHVIHSVQGTQASGNTLDYMITNEEVLYLAQRTDIHSDHWAVEFNAHMVAAAEESSFTNLCDLPPGTSVRLTEKKHNLQLVSGDVWDGNVYDQPAGGRNNSEWLVGVTADGYATFQNMKDGKYLVVGSGTNDGHVYEQDPSGDDVKWIVTSTGLPDGSVYLKSKKYDGFALVAGTVWDQHVYLQTPGTRAESQWVPTFLRPIPVPDVNWTAGFLPGASVLLTEQAHFDELVPGATYDGHVYDQSNSNAIWRVNYSFDGSVLLQETWHNMDLVVGSYYNDGLVKDQDPIGNDAEWNLLGSGLGDGSFYVNSQKYPGYAIVAGQTWDNNFYLQPPSTGPSSRWKATPLNNVIIRNRDSGACVNIKGSMTTAGTPLIVWTCDYGANSRWNVVPSAVFSNYYNIVSVMGGLCVDLVAASSFGSTLDSNPCNGYQTTQLFSITQDANGTHFKAAITRNYVYAPSTIGAALLQEITSTASENFDLVSSANAPTD